jgi:hypothetical protein
VEQNNSIKPLWFFHIPKTAGRFFYANVIRLLEHDFIASGQQYTDIVNGYGHTSFKPLDNNNVLSFSILRDPISRTISHYQHIYRKHLTGDIKEYKKEFLDFMFNNPTKEIVDYQSPVDGGKGCVRDIIEQTLRVQSKWMLPEAFEW